MHRDFWQNRWDEGRIGFHQDDINPYLVRHWSSLNLPKGSTVFVPLCGKSRDMLWLRGQGYEVLGVEVVPRAVEAFFAENALTATRRSHGQFTLWESEGIKILQGDFFDVSAADVSAVGAVYDRASLIALPKDMRERYALHLRTILPDKLGVLLITMDYVQTEMDGPPFAVTQHEVEVLYRGLFKVGLLSSEDILAVTPRFQQQGLSRLLENVYLLQSEL